MFSGLPPTSSHLHPLKVENCDSYANALFVDDEDADGKFNLGCTLLKRLVHCNAYLVSTRWRSNPVHV